MCLRYNNSLSISVVSNNENWQSMERLLLPLLLRNGVVTENIATAVNEKQQTAELAKAKSRN